LYAIAAPLESVTHIQYRALYALKDTVTPAFIGVSGGAVALITGWALIDGLHIYALPIAFVAGEFLQAGALALAVPLRMRKLQA
jgi:peptidoglycan biosynthesis protein MviN/MurJ (putative lipid II flippase)